MKNMKGTLYDNGILVAIIVIGAVILTLGTIPPHSEMLQALGAAFIIAGGVGIYMMLATRQVAKNLHQRFNEQNDTLKKQTDILQEIASSQKENHKEIVSSQKENHKEMMDVLKKIANKL